MLRLLDLFSGIGGFSLGLERSGGFKTVAFCEIEPFCRRVLAKHWPKVPCYDDVRTLTAARLADDGVEVDVICGGFPCQDISSMGRREGLEGKRSGLWSEIARLSGELRPSYIVLENVSALLGRGLDRVLGDLASLGYDAEWHCIPASYLGAPHRRDRIWIVAFDSDETDGVSLGSFCQRQAADAFRSCQALADAYQVDVQGQFLGCDDASVGSESIERPAGLRRRAGSGAWAIEPSLDRVAHGVPNRVDRLGALGNAVVPQIPELIGRAILASMVAA